MKVDLQENKSRCFLCGRNTALEEHHIFPKPNRNASDEFGLTVLLCSECHTFGEYAVHNNPKVMKKLKHFGQKQAMTAFGWDNEDWLKHFTFSTLTAEEVEHFSKLKKALETKNET